MNEKVLVIVISKDFEFMPCMESINNQVYSNYKVLLHTKKPEEIHFHPQINRSKNIALNRTECQKIALASDADYFFLVDSDIILPPDAILNLLSNEKDMVAGWYKIRDQIDRWVAAKWVDNNILHQYDSPKEGLIEVDVAGLGCLMLSRKAFKDAVFRDGWDRVCFNDLVQDFVFLGESADFSNCAFEKGYKMYMDGRVICNHQERPKEIYEEIMPKTSICAIINGNIQTSKELINSIKLNNKFPYELILIDNTSDKEVSEYLKKETQKYLKFESKVSLGKAWNNAIEMAENEYLFLCEDNLILPQHNWIRNFISLIQINNADMMFHSLKNKEFESNNIPRKILKYKDLCHASPIFTKKSILEKVNKFDEDYSSDGEIEDIQIRLLKNDHNILSLDNLTIIDERLFQNTV